MVCIVFDSFYGYVSIRRVGFLQQLVFLISDKLCLICCLLEGNFDDEIVSVSDGEINNSGNMIGKDFY